MSRLIAAVLAALIGGFAAFHASVWAAPRLILAVAHERMAERAGGVNRMLPAPPPAPGVEEIVRPSPDLLYSICAFDLSDGPVEITAAATEAYLSLAVFDAATNNILTLRGQPGEPVALRLALAPDASGETRVSPSARGIALVRRRVSTPDTLAAAQAAQSSDACRPI